MAHLLRLVGVGRAVAGWQTTSAVGASGRSGMPSFRGTGTVRCGSGTGKGVESFANGTSANYEERMYRSWREDPSSVHASWAAYFGGLESGLPSDQAHMLPPALGGQPGGSTSAQPGVSNVQAIRDALTLRKISAAFQRNGHQEAQLDPLERGRLAEAPELMPEHYGYTEADLDRPIYVGNDPPIRSLAGKEYVTLRETVAALREAYCGTIGLEFTHLQDSEMLEFLRDCFEQPPPVPNKEESLVIYDRLAWSEMFEKFLETKYGGAKRFGLEGCESLIPGFKAMIDEAAEHGCEDVVIGMPHRGRLNVLCNVVRKPLPGILSEFAGSREGQSDSFSGDVKYHLGTAYNRNTREGKRIGLYLAANPSHLEAVNPVVCGRTMAMQFQKEDQEGRKVCAVLMHGDAAFAGQGVVYESLHLNDLPDYTTKGSIHIVVNNQIGFTTDPRCSRSTLHPTDVAKNIHAPIVHVNADDIESVERVFRIAARFRQRFGEDFVIDLVGYRRHGHNEIDPADMTQPLMYQQIAKHPSALTLYRKQLLESGRVEEADLEELEQNIKHVLETSFKEAKTYVPEDREWKESRWSNLSQLHEDTGKPRRTAIDADLVAELGETLTTLPKGFTAHKQIKKLLKKKQEMFRDGTHFDWGTAEALAFGSLVKEGVHVRLSGQDSERGTFAHRHARMHDQKTGESYMPLEHIVPRGLKICNSSLSEFGVLGFELGYSLQDPNFLVLWEAQFGDFANGAQIIIDQFLSSGEQKWHRQSGLVLLLPHGYSGQGPEHSSARLERFLAMTDTDPNSVPDLSTLEKRQAYVHRCNWQVCNVTNPANYFHLLRRQIHRPFRKPLCLMSPKNLLRHPEAISSLDEFTETEIFTRVYSESNPEEIDAPEKVKRLILCSGKVFYEIREARRKAGIKDVAIARVEQLAPFPFDCIQNVAKEYPNAEVVWCQEEPENMGAWHYMFFHLRTALRADNIRAPTFEPIYAGRVSAASPATGFLSVHETEQEELIKKALTTSS